MEEPSYQTREERLKAKPLDWNSTVGKPKPHALSRAERDALRRARPETSAGGAPDPKADEEARKQHDRQRADANVVHLLDEIPAVERARWKSGQSAAREHCVVLHARNPVFEHAGNHFQGAERRFFRLRFASADLERSVRHESVVRSENSLRSVTVRYRQVK